MSESKNKNLGILGAVAVLVAGLIATYVLYGNQSAPQAESTQVSGSEISGVEPAAGTPAEENKAIAAPEEAAPDASTGTAVIKDEGEDSGASTDNTMSSGQEPAPDAGGATEPAPAPAQ